MAVPVAPARRGLPRHWVAALVVVTGVVLVVCTAASGLPWLGLWLAGFVPVGYGLVQLVVRRRPLLALGLMGGGLCAGLIGLVGVAATLPAPAPPGSAPTSAATAAEDASQAPGAAQPTPSTVGTEPRTAQQAAARLDVRERGPRTGYARALFAPNSLDLDRNGCDQRNDVLRRDLTDPVITPGSHGCRVESGWLQDRYSGIARHLSRDQIDIDHVVALSNAWQTGAADWDPAMRVAFANDPLNLVATTPALNRQKGDGDAATWLPPDRRGRCDYVARQITVKWRYQLALTPPEREAIERVLEACPDHPLADPASAPGPMSATESPTAVTPGALGTVAPSPAESRPRTATQPTKPVTPTQAAPTPPATKKAAPQQSTPTKATPTDSPATKSSATKAAPRKAAPKKAATKKAAPKKAPKASAPGSGGSDPRFGTCREAKKNGYGPYVQGTDPEYEWYRDGDGDGIVCE